MADAENAADRPADAPAPAGHAAAAASGSPGPPPPADGLPARASAPPHDRSRAGRPWGFWATVGLTALLLVVWYVLRTVLLVVLGIGLVVLGGVLRPPAVESLLQSHAGLINVVAITLLSLPMLGLLALLSAGGGMPIRRYLARDRPRPKETFLWLMGGLALIVLMDLGYRWIGIDPVTDFEVEFYATTPAVALLFGLMVVAPVLEETWWRGFVYRGIAASRAGPLLAVVLPAVPFTLMHTQYEWVHLPAIFAMGLFLGATRWHSRSTVLAMVCHAGLNLFYFASTAVEVEWLGRTAAGT